MLTKTRKPRYPVRGEVLLIPTGDIRPNPTQPRREFPLAGLVELAQSISENGILQPLTVDMSDGTPVLIAGERRLRAAKIAGIAEVPCITVQTDDRRRQILALVENLQREDMNCFEIAEGIRMLMESCDLAQWEVAEQLGYSASAVANKLRLLRLTPEQREKLIAAGLTERHARALLRLEDEALRVCALGRIIEGNLTVAQTERLVDDLLAGRAHRPAKPLVRDMRVFFNTVNHAVDILRRGGINAESTRREEGEYIEVVVRIPKRQS